MPLHVINASAHAQEDYPLDPRVLEVLEQSEIRHFWHRSRNRWIHRALRTADIVPPALVLDVGCGSGGVATFLHQVGYRVVAVDTAGDRVRVGHKRASEIDYVIGEVRDLPEALQGPFDAIGCFDVLEHLDQPTELISDALTHARPGTAFLATVPARQDLFTAIDTLSGHKRRYEQGQLAELLKDAGLVDCLEYGIFRSTLPLQRLVRTDNSPAPPPGTDEAAELMTNALKTPAFPVNQALDAVCWLEEQLAFGAAQGKGGASLIGVGRVPDSRA